MKTRAILFLAVFLSGYVTNDLLNLFEVEVLKPAYAQTGIYSSEIKRIVEDCKVYVYDVNDGEGIGDIFC